MYRNVVPTAKRRKQGSGGQKFILGGGALVALTGILFLVVKDVQPTQVAVSKTIEYTASAQ